MTMIFRSIVRISQIGVIALLLGCALTAPALAAETGALGIFPSTYDDNNPLTRSWFIYNLQPEQTKTDSFTVVNNSSEPLDVSLYPVDASTTTDGAFTLKSEQEDRQSIGSWVTLSTTHVHLKASERRQIPFTITIPKNKLAGDYAGGIVVQKTAVTPSSQGNLKVNIVSRVGVRIYETVPGDQQASLEITNFSRTENNEHDAYSFSLKNTGNVILYPTGTVTTKNWNGQTVQSNDLTMLGSLFPGKDTSFQVPYKFDTWFIDHYQATLTIKYGPHSAVEKQLSYYSFNWAAIAVAVIVGLIILLVRRKHTTRRQHGEAPQPTSLSPFEYQPPSVIPQEILSEYPSEHVTKPRKQKAATTKRQAKRATKPTKKHS